jgi:hypothetical protein
VIAWEKRVRGVVSKFLVAAMMPVIKDIATRLAESERRNRELEQRYRALAATIETEVFRFAGTWRQDKTFVRGSVVVHSGSVWFANETNDVRPGTSGDWQLVVKRGAFADERKRDSAKV